MNFSPPEPFEGKTYIDIIGTLPDGCTEIDDISHTYEDATVHVTITVSQRLQGVTPFKETIRVDTPSPRLLKRYDFIVPLTPDPGS